MRSQKAGGAYLIYSKFNIYAAYYIISGLVYDEEKFGVKYLLDCDMAMRNIDLLVSRYGYMAQLDSNCLGFLFLKELR